MKYQDFKLTNFVPKNPGQTAKLMIICFNYLKISNFIIFTQPKIFKFIGPIFATCSATKLFRELSYERI